MTKSDLVVLEVYQLLFHRYTEMAKNTGFDAKVSSMMSAILGHCLDWPPDKTGRWLGYVQAILIEVVSVTTIEKERNFTRPLFHSIYESRGFPIPASLTTK